jgi:uncharacterized protein (TIGR00251 family)
MALRIAVTVKPNAKKSEIVEQGANQYRASVRSSAQDGKANRELIDLLAAHFGLPKSTVKIAHGHAARRKIIDIG